MVDSAAELGLEALALVDRDGVYGAVQFAEAAADSGIATIFGAELTLTQSATSASPSSQSSVPSPQPASSTNERILTVLCRGAEGYRRLSRVISDAHMCTGEKNEVRYPPIDELARRGGDHWIILADYSWTPHLDELVEHFPRVVVELDRLLTPDDADRHEEQLKAAEQLGLAAVYSSAATAARPKSGRLAGAKTALRYRKDVEDAEPYTHPIGGTYLRSGAEMFDADYPELTANTLAVARECAFTLTTIAPELPDWPVPEGYTEITWLEHMVEERGAVRYGSREDNPAAWAQIDHELNVIGNLNFPGYFLIVTDLVDFCRQANILAQGRGSSGNSPISFSNVSLARKGKARRILIWTLSRVVGKKLSSIATTNMAEKTLLRWLMSLHTDDGELFAMQPAPWGIHPAASTHGCVASTTPPRMWPPLLSNSAGSPATWGSTRAEW